MDAATLREAMGRALSLDRYAGLVDAFNDGMIAADCTNEARAAMWCAQLGHESVGLKYMEEIASGQAYEGRQDLGNTQRGDGRRFKGRGPIQLTGRHNYGVFGAWCRGQGYVSSADYFTRNPVAVAEPRWGFLAASWYWVVARPRLNALSDAGDIVGATRAINGGTHGLDDRRSRWVACGRLGRALLPSGAAPAAATSNVLGTELVMDPIPFTGEGSRRVFLDPPGSAVIARAFFSWAIDGREDGATAALTAYPQRPGGGTGEPIRTSSTVRTDGTHTVDRAWFEVPAGTDQVTVQFSVPEGSTAYLVPAFTAQR
jgi:predicted chitinase